MKQLILDLIILLLLFSSVNAQQRVTGRITDEQNSPLPGVNIIIKGQTIGTISDLDGNYSIQVMPTDTLQFSMMGMESQEIPVNDKTSIDAILKTLVTELDEIVVIGYGSVRKSDLTGSVASVKGDDINQITSLNAEQGLQGKVTGVQITSTSGAPGAQLAVRIRGVGTFNNSSPIFVVDGVILNDISFLNSADIASMEVLKDASATAIYGSRGANGVIIVTTKTGEAGQKKPSFSYSGEYGIQKLAKKIDLLNGREFAIISNEIRAGSYNNVDAVPNTDWQDLIFNTAPVQSHRLSVTGATELAKYYVSVGYFNQVGIIDKSGYERLTIKLNNEYKISDKLKLGNNITLAPYKQQNAPNVTYSVYRAQPLLEPYYDNGSFAVVYNVGNPLADLAYSNDFNKGLRGVGSFYAEAALLKSFVFKSSYGVDAAYNKVRRFTPAYTIYNPDGTASQQQNVLSDIYKENNENLSWLWENTLTYIQDFNKHSVNAVAGYTMQNVTSEKFEIPGENVLRDGEDFWYINPSYIVDPNNNVNTVNRISNTVDANLYYSMISYLFRANYTYNNKYLLTFTFRRDGSSKFSKENQYSNFPSFAAGWNVSREPYMKNITAISKLKIRGSWGIIGNEKITYYDRYARVESGLIAVFGRNQSPFAGATYGKNGNPDLKWESTTQTDLGMEIGLFENRLTGEFDFYRRVTDDILVELSTPGYLGNGEGQKIRFNAASVLNRGIEAMINFRGRINNLDYTVGVMGSSIHNEVLEIGGNTGIDSVLIGGYLGNGIPVTQSRIGIPIGSFYGYKTQGIFQDQSELDAYPHTSQAGIGDLRFVDVNGDNIINGNDRTYIGSPIPKFIFGINTDLGYKGFDFSMAIQGQTGNKIFNGKEVVRPDPYNFEKHVFDRWTGPGTSNTEPKPSFGGYNYTPSDRFIQDGSFIRLRSLVIGYTLPEKLINKLKLSQLRFYFKGTNLYTLTKFTGYTPEIGSSDVLSNSIDKGIYPISAIYSFGANLTF
jgi:TonB-linked SusC/RagA family outer membrane protein